MIRSAVDRLRDEFHEFEELIGSCRDQLEEIVDEGTPEDVWFFFPSLSTKPLSFLLFDHLFKSCD